MLYFRKAKPGDDYKGYLQQGKLKEGREDLVMVAMEGDRLVGACSLEIIPDGVDINSIYVDKDVRGQGIGYALVKSILNVAERRGIRWAWVEDREELRLFFEKLGFHPSDKKPGLLVVDMKGYFDSCSGCKGDE